MSTRLQRAWGLRGHLGHMAFWVLGKPVFDGPPIALGGGVGVERQRHAQRFIDEPGTHTHDRRQCVPAAVDGRSAKFYRVRAINHAMTSAAI